MQKRTGPEIRRAVKALQVRQQTGGKVDQAELNKAVAIIRRQAMKELIR